MANLETTPSDPPPPPAGGNGSASGMTPNSNDTSTINDPASPQQVIIIGPRAASLSILHIVLTSCLMALCVVTFLARIYRRMTPVWKMGVDDYFIILGFALTVVDFGMLMPNMTPVQGPLPITATSEAGKLSWLAIGIWGLSMTCIKLSIAFTLLRIRGEHLGWKIFLYSIMIVQLTYGIGNILFNLVIACQPLEAAWRPELLYTPGSGARCVPVEVMTAVSNAGSAINITTDFLLSLAPATFLRKLNRPLRERVFVCALMAMGLLASGASVAKTVAVKAWGEFDNNTFATDAGMALMDDWMATGITICTWTVLEQQLGLLAACIPALKGVLQTCLGRMGVSLTVDKSRTTGAGASTWKNGTELRSIKKLGKDKTTTTTSRDLDSTFRRQSVNRLEGDARQGGKEMLDTEAGVESPNKTLTPSSKWLEDDWTADRARTDSRTYLVDDERPERAI